MSKKYKLLVALSVAVLTLATTACTSLSSGSAYTWEEIEQAQRIDK